MLSMKNKYIILGLIAGFLCSCQDDEVLNLKSYPQNDPTFSVEGSNGMSNVYLSATYQQDRSLKVNGEIKRTYTFHILPSPEDAVIEFFPIHTNIPEDKVEISTKEVLIPAGFSEATVEVGLKDNDFSFAAENLSEMTYELGVKANVIKGIKTSESSLESKIIINKEAFFIWGSINGEGNNSAFFERIVDGNNIVDSKPITYKFKIKQDKPSAHDIKYRLLYEGIDENFLKDITVTPSDIVIPAGKTESEEVTWSMKDDFVLSTSTAGVFDFYLSLTIESQEEHIAFDPKKEKIYLRTSKSVKNIANQENIDNNWIELDRKQWEASEFKNWSWNTNGANFFDGNNKTYNRYSDRTVRGEFIVDLKSEETLKGIQLENAFSYRYYYGAKNVSILTSADKDSWINHGEIHDLKNGQFNHIQFIAPVKARYVKFSFSNYHNDMGLWLAEIKMYK